ncbi:MAG: hypothetical protein A2178_01915 [Planctomycetes bacterium GWC2_49_10]|nr:MAG: hypothetical protein A2178_01915 [Planctomycetes bacterium GWC2_49_10]
MRASINNKYIVLLLLVVVFLTQMLFYYPRLPDRMATHFGASGVADAWQSKTFFVLFESIMLIFVMVSVVLVPAICLKYLPDELVRLPNKEYWFAAERRDATRKKIHGMMLPFAIVVLIFFICGSQLVINANLDGSGKIDNCSMYMLLVALLIFVVLWIYRLCRMWAMPK